MDHTVRTLIHSADLADGSEFLHDAWVLLAPSGVVATGAGDTYRELITAHDHVIDASEVAGSGAIVSPGLIDIHAHGGAGASFDDGAEAIRTARAMHRMHGTTRSIVSLVTADWNKLVQRANAVGSLMHLDDDILGVHLEGPCLDPGHKGAHEESLLRNPDDELIQALAEIQPGVVKQITLAPELTGALDSIRTLVASGVAVAVGHTNADAAVTRDAFDAGATILTHAFNAMPPIHHRAPGPVVAAVSDPRVTIEIIADAVHVDLDLIRMIFASAPGRVALITDAMAAAGAGDGSYVLGNLAVTVTDGVARLTDGDSIAGSTLTQDVALRNVVNAGVPLGQAFDALTRAPAAAIGLDDQFGRLRPGFAADAVLWDRDLMVRGVWVSAVRV